MKQSIPLIHPCSQRLTVFNHLLTLNTPLSADVLQNLHDVDTTASVDMGALHHMQLLIRSSSDLPLAMRRTRMTRMMVGFMGIIPDSISSKTIPTIERKTMATSSWFHLNTVEATAEKK